MKGNPLDKVTDFDDPHLSLSGDNNEDDSDNDVETPSTMSIPTRLPLSSSPQSPHPQSRKKIVKLGAMKKHSLNYMHGDSFDVEGSPGHNSPNSSRVNSPSSSRANLLHKKGQSGSGSGGPGGSGPGSGPGESIESNKGTFHKGDRISQMMNKLNSKWRGVNGVNIRYFHV